MRMRGARAGERQERHVPAPWFRVVLASSAPRRTASRLRGARWGQKLVNKTRASESLSLTVFSALPLMQRISTQRASSFMLQVSPVRSLRCLPLSNPCPRPFFTGLIDSVSTEASSLYAHLGALIIVAPSSDRIIIRGSEAQGRPKIINA